MTRKRPFLRLKSKLLNVLLNKHNEVSRINSALKSSRTQSSNFHTLSIIAQSALECSRTQPYRAISPRTIANTALELSRNQPSNYRKHSPRIIANTALELSQTQPSNYRKHSPRIIANTTLELSQTQPSNYRKHNPRIIPCPVMFFQFHVVVSLHQTKDHLQTVKETFHTYMYVKARDT